MMTDAAPDGWRNQALARFDRWSLSEIGMLCQQFASSRDVPPAFPHAFH